MTIAILPEGFRPPTLVFSLLYLHHYSSGFSLISGARKEEAKVGFATCAKMEIMPTLSSTLPIAHQNVVLLGKDNSQMDDCLHHNGLNSNESYCRQTGPNDHDFERKFEEWLQVSGSA